MYKVSVGKKTLDNLTISMYKNPRIIFREYVQNATDAIDDAVRVGFLAKDEGRIEITIDKSKRQITIEDNGTGISALTFQRKLIDIGNSDKSLANDRGYRGIGRLCGLAFCKTLIFTSTTKGETVKSIMVFDADKLNAMLNDDEKYTAEIVLNEVVKFDKAAANVNEHFFKVELFGVKNVMQAADILLDVDEVRDYLSFVAPVPYNPDFGFQKQIYTHAATLNFHITEYDISVNDKQIFKDYQNTFTTQMGADEIFALDFRDFRDEDGNLIAWSWIGLSQFKGVIQQSKNRPNKMRSIRLRQKNIQIGDDKVFQDRRLFTEDRGTTYFVGEVHAVDTNLKPNSQRDYFIENDACEVFEAELKDYFTVLTKLYRYASKVRSAFRAVYEPEKFLQGLELHTPEYRETHMAEHEAELAKLERKADETQDFIDGARREAEANPDEITSQVFVQIDDNIDMLDDPLPYPPPNQNFRRRIGRVRKPSFTMRFTR